MDNVIAKGMAKNPLDRYLSCGDLANAAHDALTTPEQRQEATILRQGDNETLMAVVDPSAARLVARPDPVGPARQQARLPP